MKRFAAGAIALVMLCVFAFPCAAVASEGKLSVVTTIFPVFDWMRRIVGDNDNVEITLLLDSGVDLHSYQPTARDMLRIATCDLFSFVGGESDAWVADALASATNPDMVVVSLVEAVGEDIRMEAVVEGLEHEKEEDESHEHDEGHEHEADEHVWLSLRNAEKLVKALAAALSDADPANAESYAANAETYAGELDALDAEYAAACAAADFDTLLFGDRFPFRYMVEDYGLNYYAAFSGCSAESEASFETVVFLADRVDALGLPAVLTIEGGNRRIAETVVKNTQARTAKVLTLDSMQGTTGEDVKNGVTYLGVMQANLEVLKQALTK